MDEVGDFIGDFEQDMEGDLVMSRSGLVQVWFSLQPKFNSFELDSEVGRLVLGYIQTLLQNGVSNLVSIVSTAYQRMEVDYIVEQNATLLEMQHQKNMATARLCAEYDGRLVRKNRVHQVSATCSQKSHQGSLRSKV